jgi:uncharacterized protein YciI
MEPQDRRHFIGIGIAAAIGGLATSAVAQADRRTATGETAVSPSRAAPSETAAPIYLVIYKQGPRWVDGKPMRDQLGMPDHFQYYIDLYRAGRLRDAGGFTDGSGGAAIFEAIDDAAAEAFIKADPAVTSGTFAYELKRWRPNPWAEISKVRAARGE